MRYLLFIFITIFSISAFSQATDLIISEYVEGSSNNKYIELYNGTTAPINLTNYELRLYANGSATPTNTLVLTGTLAVGSTIVYRNSAATLYAGASTVTAVCAFNGDDAVVLFKISTSAFIDIVGNIGCDPGTAWTNTNTTLDRTLVRNSNVCSGITTDPGNSPCDFPTLASEWTQFGLDVVSNLGSHTMTCSPCIPASAPTTPTTSAVNTPSCTSDALSWTNGNGTNRIVVVSTSPIVGSPVNQTNYTAGSYGAGATLNAGEFVVYNGTGNSTTISGLTPGTTYFYTIFEYNVTTTSCTESYLTSSTLSGSFTTITGCGPSTPQILGLLANSCSTDEGLNEFFVFQNGTSPQSLSTMTVNFPSFTYCNSSCGTQTLLNNTSAITALNTAAGCALFTFADPIPANATVVVFTGNPPTAPPNFSAQCGQTYYAIFCNNPADVSGRFANSGTGTRTLSVNFGATTDAVTYDMATISNTDGAYVGFDYPGNPFYSVISNCAGPLGLDLLQWKGSYSESGNILEWKTTNESHVSHFEVLKLNDQNKFIIIDQLPANNTKIGGNYFSVDRENQNTSFYQLKSIDQNGSFSLSPILKVDASFENMLIGFNNGHFVANDWEQIDAIQLLAMNGQAVFSATKNELLNANHPIIPTGMYILQVTKRNGEQFTQKLPVNAF